ncbi:FAD-dependent oxidoreductase [Acidiferrimicrobium sp. IK]|uniref:FAD-dependent oxidoreductase n=1 Tax=Acidiferrimicrobium sp. IK TaxID=2871700 RepID=UPI0039673978
MSSTAPIAPRPASSVRAWDATTDVLVVGFGAAGASAAIGAAAAGAEVTVVERAGAPGGASAMAGGEIYLGGGTPVQKACGFEDTAEAMRAFLAAATGPGIDEERLDLYCEGSVEHFTWLADMGVPFKASFCAEPCWEPPGDDGLTYSGGENTWPFNEIAPPAPRAHVPQMSGKKPGRRSGGWKLMEHLSAQCRESGVASMLDGRVVALVSDADGAVAGAVIRRFGEELAVRATKGVVLASGGFGANPDMVALHAPQLCGQMPLGTDGDDGSSIRLGQGAGGFTRRMDAAQTAIPTVPALLYPSIAVNRFGQRFINEDTYAGRVGQAAVFHQGAKVALVMDEAIFESVPEADRWGARPTWAAGSVAELEAEMSLPTGSLQATVSLYNEHAARGCDPVFHKRPEWCRPLRPPFGAIDLSALPYAVFTLGGLVTTVDGEVVGSDGPIPGLFAAGRATSGIPAWGYVSGTSLGDATFFGRRAGRAAARRERRPAART